MFKPWVKSGTTEHNVCVDRKVDNFNLQLSIEEADRMQKLRDLQMKVKCFQNNNLKKFEKD